MTHVDKHLSHDQVSAFIDGELPSAEMRELEQHLADCHPCALRIVSATQLKAAVARAAQDFVAPSEAIDRLAAQLRAHAPTRTARLYSFRSVTLTALAACLILALPLFGWWQHRQSTSLTAELLDQHLAVLSSGSSPEVISSDRHTVKPWFQGRLPFSFNLPDALPANTTLEGGDLTFLRGRPAALLLFTIGRHRVSVFLTQRSIAESGPATQSGFATRYANTHDLRIIAVSDVNPADLALLVSALADAQIPR